MAVQECFTATIRSYSSPSYLVHLEPVGTRSANNEPPRRCRLQLHKSSTGIDFVHTMLLLRQKEIEPPREQYLAFLATFISRALTDEPRIASQTVLSEVLSEVAIGLAQYYYSHSTRYK